MRPKLIDILGDAPEAGLMAQTVVKRINLLDALHMIKRAWAKLTTATIQNYWKTERFANDEL